MSERSSSLQGRLTRLLWLSIGAALLTIGLKTAAWLLTDSVGLLSDAAESIVNLVAASVALATLHWASQPPDPHHPYGHEKAEYFSAGLEGGMILLAAVSIAWFALERLLHPAALQDVAAGLAVSAVASAINLWVGVQLVRAGRRHRSIVLEADGRHLLTDVWTSGGVIVGVALVAVTGVERLDPLIALVVAANIVFTGIGLLRRSIDGLIDRSLPSESQAAINARDRTIRHRRGHVSRPENTPGRQPIVHLPPRARARVVERAGWAYPLEQLDRDLRQAVPGATVFTHLEPIEDPESFADTSLERDKAGDRGV